MSSNPEAPKAGPCTRVCVFRGVARPENLGLMVFGFPERGWEMSWSVKGVSGVGFRQGMRARCSRCALCRAGNECVTRASHSPSAVRCFGSCLDVPLIFCWRRRRVFVQYDQGGARKGPSGRLGRRLPVRDTTGSCPSGIGGGWCR